MLDEFEKHLRRENLSQNTISAYLLTVRMYEQLSGEMTKANLLAFKGYLMETYKPKTVNLRIQAINKYLDFIKKPNLRLSPVKIQQKNFLENVISDADYKFLKNRLKRDGNMEWYFVVRYLAATGARVSELIQIKVEHVFNGYFDLYSKGGKLRRLYIPKTLKTETEAWLNEKGITSGYLFSFRRAYHRARNRPATQKLCRQIRFESKSRVSAFVPTSVCQKLFGEV